MSTYNYYKGSDGNIATAGNWTLGVPAAGQICVIPEDAAGENLLGDLSGGDLIDGWIFEDGCGLNAGSGSVPMGLNTSLLTVRGNGSIRVKGTITKWIVAGNGSLYVYPGTTQTSGELTSGLVRNYDTITTVKAVGSGQYLHNDGNLTTYNGGDSSRMVLNSTGTLGTFILSGGAELDAGQDGRAKTVATLKMNTGTTMRDPLGILTLTNPLQLVGCGWNDVTIVRPPNYTIAFGAI